MFVGALSILTPILSAAITFLRYQERSTTHHDAATRFSALKRALELEAANFKSSADGSAKSLAEVRDKWDQLTLDAPALYKMDWSEIAEFDQKVER